MSSPAHRRLFPLAAWLLALAALLAAPLRVAAVMTPPAKIASWGFDAPPSGRPGDQPPANQDCIRLCSRCAYEPASGRSEWLSRDPMEDAELLPDGPNLYGYVRNNPLNWIDPFGGQGVPATNSVQANPMLAADVLADVAAANAERELAKQIAKRCTERIGKLASEWGKKSKDIEKALHKLKQDAGLKGKNVKIDPKTGEVYPKGSGGNLGDSIGNVRDALP